MKFRVEELIGNLLLLKKQNDEGAQSSKIDFFCQSMLKACPIPLLNRAKHLDLAIVDRKYARGSINSYERLNRNLLKAVGNYERAVCGLDKYLKECLWLEDLQKSKEMGFRDSELNFTGRNVPLIGRLIWIYYCFIQQYFYFCLGILFAMLSFMVVVG